MATIFFTDKNMMNPKSDWIVFTGVCYFYDPYVFNSLEMDPVFSVNSVDLWREGIGEMREVGIPAEFRRMRSKATVGQARLENWFRKDIVYEIFVNGNFDFKKVARRFPNAIVVGYADEHDDLQKLIQQSGVEDPLFIGPRLKDQNNVLRFGYDLISYGFHKEIARAGILNARVAESLRQIILGLNETGGDGCGWCDGLRKYKLIQEWLLENDPNSLYGYSPFNGFASIDDMPKLGNIGRVCYQYKGPIYNILEGKIGERLCCGKINDQHEFAIPAVLEFQRAYKDLEEKVKG